MASGPIQTAGKASTFKEIARALHAKADLRAVVASAEDERKNTSFDKKKKLGENDED